MVSLEQLESLRKTFNSSSTQSYAFRKEQLRKLKQSILAHEQELYDALYADLKKSREEVWVTETGMVLAELSEALRQLKHWMEPESVATNLLNLPSSSYILKEPLGVVLIIGPWNYPFQLLINPLIGAIAAGNCVVLKPSEFSPATTATMKKIIESVFSSDYILYAEGEGAVVVPAMMHQFCFDHVFYTGSSAVGKIIYQLAAEKLVPVTLELGGKSPCVVEADANIHVAAKRIAMTKFNNAGQMCVAPDYILVHQSKKEALIHALKTTIVDFFGTNAANCDHYGKIINAKQFDRILGYLKDGTILQGGNFDRTKLYIEPTLIEMESTDKAIMQEEIFGPVLPIIGFSTMEEALAIIAKNKNPLAFYLFSSSAAKEKEWLCRVPSGGGCINNASWHLTNHHLPFGGRGCSGTGQYHGRYSFNSFSHQKAIMKTPTWFDPAIKYPPFKGKLKWFKLIIK